MFSPFPEGKTSKVEIEINCETAGPFTHHSFLSKNLIYAFLAFFVLVVVKMNNFQGLGLQFRVRVRVSVKIIELGLRFRVRFSF